MRTKTFAQIQEQATRLMSSMIHRGKLPKVKQARFNRVQAVTKRYMANAFNFCMLDENIKADLDALPIPRSVYAKQV